MNKRTIGSKYEQKAVDFMEKQGFQLLDQNFRVRQGEIDIIGLDGEILVFAEVKFRKNMGIKNAMESVNIRKQRQICKLSLFYLNYHKELFKRQIRYDVVAMDEEEICWVKNAFLFQT